MTTSPAPDETYDFVDSIIESDTEPVARRRHHVSAVLVAHNGARWLPAVLRTLSALTTRPDDLVAVDTGSLDDSAALLRDALGADSVVSADADCGFGAAIRMGLAHLDARRSSEDGSSSGEEVDWVWILHDDSAPDADALEALLLESDRSRSAAVLGPKVRGWHDGRLLLEAGISVTGGGRRDTGLERHEQDQGQHDGVRDVLAVGSAGMLIRRDVWDELGGLDPQIAMFRDDIDFGWRANLAGHRVVVTSDAVMHHAEAGAHGRRRLDSVVDHPYRADREASGYVALTHASPLALPFVVLRLVLGAAFRAIGFLIGKDTRSAVDEIAAVSSTLASPGRIRRGRRLVADAARIRGVGVGKARRDARHLLPSIGMQLRHWVEALGAFADRRSVARQVGAGLRPESRTSVRAIEAGPAADDDEWIEREPSWLRTTLSRPGVIFGLLLTLLALIGVRALLGSGVLFGGALLPSPEGAGDLWAQYTAGWHEVGPGSATPQATYIAPLAMAATVLLGKAWLVVDIAILLAVPLAGVSAYLAMRGLIRSTPIRVWAAATYALLPAVTGAVAAGRIGTTVVAILLPVLARALVRMVGEWRTDDVGPPSWRRTWATALLLSVAVSFVPVVWLIGAVALLVAALTVVTDRGSRLRFTLVAASPVVLLMPWSFELLGHPSLLFFEAGLNSPELTDRSLSSFDVAMLHPGGPGMVPIWASAGVVLAAVVAWLRPERFAVVAGCWVVGLIALAFGVLDVVVRFTPPWASDPVRAWPGTATLVLGAAAIVSAAAAAEGAREYLSGIRFGVVQPIVLAVFVGAVVGPAYAALDFASGVSGPITRGVGDAVPAYVDADMRGPERPRALVLRAEAGGRVGYSLLGRPLPTLGDADAAPPGSAYALVDKYVASLASGRGGNEVEGLAGYAVRYVLLRDPASTARSVTPRDDVVTRRTADLVATLDSEAGLRRLSTTTGDALWRIALPGVLTSRGQLTSDKGVALSTVPMANTGTDIGPVSVNTALRASKGERVMLLSESESSNWQATFNGQVMPSRTVSVDPSATREWFSVPATAGTMQIRFDESARHRWLWAQLFAFLGVVILALPSRRRIDDPDPDDELQTVTSW